MLGTRTLGGRMEGADKSTELDGELFDVKSYMMGSTFYGGEEQCYATVFFIGHSRPLVSILLSLQQSTVNMLIIKKIPHDWIRTALPT